MEKIMNETAFVGFINIGVAEAPENDYDANQLDCDTNIPIDCKDRDVFKLMMKTTIEKFKDIHFYKLGKPATVQGTNSCNMALHYRPNLGSQVYKDYRRFGIKKSENCTASVMGIVEYHFGVNVRKRKKNLKPIRKSTWWRR